MDGHKVLHRHELFPEDVPCNVLCHHQLYICILGQNVATITGWTAIIFGTGTLALPIMNLTVFGDPLASFSATITATTTVIVFSVLHLELVFCLVTVSKFYTYTISLKQKTRVLRC